jgi:EmrB/QacA subfamily drug resistance transporter
MPPHHSEIWKLSASLQSNRGLVIASVMASMFMVAIEATIVSTVMPQIVADLGGLRLYSWVFSSFLLAQTAMTVVFGNLADIYGRKPVMLAGIVIFLIGSLLAGFAWSMPSMIVFRLIQGVGAGAIQPVAMTIVADLYPARERGKIQGYLASVWAISAVFGPIAGGLIIRNVSWAWVFWINIPVGLATMAGFMAFLKENAAHERRSIDIGGAVAFTILVTSFLIALTEIGGIDQARLGLASAVFVVSTLAFVWQERRAANPMVSFALWSRRPIAATNAVGLLAGMTLMGLTTFLPIYVQIVLQRSPVVAGLALTTMLVGWPAGAVVAARLFHRVALQRLLLAGTLLLPVGAVLLVALRPQSSPVVAALGSLIMGFGMGLISISSLVLTQELVDASQRGSVTASVLFSRNVGSTLGATVLGAVLNHGLTHASGFPAVTSDQLRQLLSGQPHALPGGQLQIMPGDAILRLAMQHSLNLTFWAMLAMALATVLVALLIPAPVIAAHPSSHHRTETTVDTSALH